MRRSHSFVAGVVVCLGASAAFAQGQQYGTVSGRASSADGLPLPGVSVTVSSEALQGTRTAITDINGVYSLPGLTPGQYVVTFKLDSMTTIERRAIVSLGALAVVDQQLKLAPVQETVDVRGTTPSAVTSHGTTSPPSVRGAVAAGRAHAVPPRGTHTGADRQHAEQNAGHDFAAASPTTTSS